jgi:hypothetical protein
VVPFTSVTSHVSPLVQPHCGIVEHTVPAGGLQPVSAGGEVSGGVEPESVTVEPESVTVEPESVTVVPESVTVVPESTTLESLASSPVGVVPLSLASSPVAVVPLSLASSPGDVEPPVSSVALVAPVSSPVLVLASL